MSEPGRSYPALDVSWPGLPASNTPLDELLASTLDDLTAVGAQEFDGSWRVFFASPQARDRAARLLDLRFRARGVTLTPVDVADEDWARHSQAHLGPVRAGDIVVAPPWSELSASETAGVTVVRILPSMGFGTGHHATTRLCLKALSAIDLAGQSFLDIGTGSGVLAIAACLLGAAPVFAIDSDPDAIEAARRNLELNGVTDRAQLMTVDFRGGAGLGAHVVAANLTGAALTQGHRELAAAVEPGGTLLVSGFTVDEADEVLSALSRAGAITSTNSEDGWSAATLRVFPNAGTLHD